MMKITQLLTNTKLWQGIFFSFLLLVSLNLNSQNVGDDLLANSNGQVDTASGWTGSGAGCFSWGGGTYDGTTQCGWTSGAGLNYAPSNGSHGPTHTGDRMFKSYKTNGSNGEFIAQEVGELALGTYTYSFFHRWTGGSVDYTEGAPKFTIKKANADGGWDNVLAVDLAVGETGASGAWTETTGTWENTEAGQYKIQVYKNGVANAGLAQNLHLDTFSFIYTAAASSSESIPWTDSFETEDVWTNDSGSYPWKYGFAASFESPPAAAQDGSGLIYFDDYSYSTGSTGTILSPEIDLSGATAPIMTFYHYDTSNSDTVQVVDGAGTVLFTTPDVSSEWTKFTVDLASYVGGTVQVGFKGTSVYGYSNPHIDNVYVGEAPTEPAMSVSGSTDGSSATFSFTLENFTVGNAGDTGVDGHIHYSLNGGSTVMVYSSDDLTLSDLPNGDHSIVFSLVDDAHQPLDPAVESTVEFSTFDGTVACDGSYSYTYGNNEDPSNIIFSSTNAGGTVTVTVTGSTENNYDDLVVTNGAGTVLYSASGDHTGQAITSEDGTINVAIDSDGSVSGYTLDFAVTCAAAQANVTFTVNTANITVGDNGMYLGGGVFGGANAVAMSDADGDGTWEVTVAMDIGTTGNYTLLNSPNDANDWGAKEDISGQDCADAANYNDRILPAIDGDMTIQHCFGSCESDGTCPAATPTYNVSFSVDTSNYPGGLGADDTVYLNGNFNGWCGECNPMSDDDGDGIWTLTLPFEDGNYEYKFTVNGWSSQEEFTSVTEGCTVTDGTYTNRALTVAGEDMTLPTVYWNLCPGETPGSNYDVTFSVNTANITVGANGIYVGGGFLGDATAYAMSDDDGDGVYTVTINLSTDAAGGNYIYLNSPNDGGDWGTKENLEGQACADPNNYNDRIMPEFDSDTTLLACFGDCSGDGTGECSVSEDGMMMLQGILDLTVPTAGSDGKAIHLVVTSDIADLTNYGIGVANNGGGTDGQEYTFPEGSATAGMHVLVARSAEAMEAYGITGFDLVLDASSSISQNGDDAIELYFGGNVIETFGDPDTDGTGEAWEYQDSWAYMVDGAWTYGGVDCSDGTTTTCESSCPYPFVECAEPVTFPVCEDFEDGTEGWTFIDAGGATTDWMIDTPANSGENSIGHGYTPSDVAYNDWAVSPSYDTSGLADGTATVSYYEYLNWSADAQAHNVYYTTDYAGDATSATWVLLTDAIGTDAEDVFVQRTFSIPSAASVVIGFQYLNTYGADWNIDDMCIDGTLSNNDNEILDMRIYPNPVDGNYVTIQSPVQGVKEIQVYTVTGRLLMNTAINGETLDVSSFNSGFYMLKVTINGQTKVSKLVVR